MKTISTRKSARILAGSIAALLAVQALPSAQAATYYWNTTTTGLWSAGANWSDDAVTGGLTGFAPSSGDFAVFNQSSVNGAEIIQLGASTSVGGVTFANTGTTLLDSDSTALRNFTLGSGGITLAGAAGAVTLGDAINPLVIWLGSGQAWTNNSASLLTVANAIFNGTSTLTVAGAGNTTISGAITGGAGGVTKSGAGTLILSGTGNSYTGATTVNAGTLQLSGAGGTVTGATTYNLNLGGTLVVDNTTAGGGNNNARIADTSAFALNGGSFIYKGSDTTNSTETMGAISGIGNATITVSFGGTGVATLTASSFSHAAGNATNLVNGVSLGANNGSSSVAKFISSGPTLVGTTAAVTTGINAAVKNTQIVPFLVGEATATTGGLGTASGTANTFLTYVAGSGYRPLNLTDEFTSNAITAGTNTWITGATAVAASASINSLIIGGGGDLTINDGQTLTNASGAILFSGTSAINPSATTGALALAGLEGQVTVNAGITGTIGAVVTGTGGLTKSGTGTLVLSGGAANSYTGVTTVNSGTLQLGKTGAANAIGASGLTIGSTLSGLAPVVQYTGASTNMMGAGAVAISSAGQLDFNGNTDTIGAITVNATGASGNTTPLTNTAGGGNLTIGALAITPVTGFRSQVNSGTGTLTLGGNVSFNAAGSGQGQISGNLALGAARTFTVGSGSGAGYDLLVDAVISGVGFGITKDGPGVLMLMGANTYTGNTSLTNNTATGIIRSGANDVLSNASTLTPAGGGTIDLNGFNDTVNGTGGNAIYFGLNAVGQTMTIATGAGTLTLGGNIGQDSNGFGTKAITGNLNLGGGTRTIGASGGVLSISALVSNGGISAGGGLLLSGANTFAGGITLTGNTTQVGVGNVGTVGAITSSALGTAGLIFGGGTLSSDGTTPRTILNAVTFTASGAAGLGNATNTGVLTFSAGVDLGATAHTITVNSSAQFDGVISGALGGFTKAGAGTLTITNPLNTYTGGTSVSAGILRSGASNVLPDTGALNLSGTGTVDLAGFNDTVASMYLGVNAAGQTASVTTGLGMLTLAGNIASDSNAFGNQLISGNLGLGAGTRVINLGVGSNTAKTLTISANISGGVGAGITLTNGAGATLLLTGANTYDGPTTLNSNTLALGGGNVGSVGAITSSPIGVGTLTFNGGNLASDSTTARTVLNAVSFTGNATLGSATNTGKLTFGANANLGGAVRTLTLNSDAQFDGILSSASGGIIKAGTSTLTLTGANTYTGLTTVSAGKLILDVASGDNSAATGGMTLSGGIAQFNSALSIPGTTRNVTVTGPGVALFGSTFDTTSGGDIATALLSRVVAASTGAIGADNYAATNFDFSTAGLTAASFGAVGSVTYTGTLTPNANTYRLGGGGGTLVFTPSGGTFDNTQALVINGNSNTGTVDFGGLSKSLGAITFAGGTASNGTLTGTSYSGTGGTVTLSLAGSGAFTSASGTTTLNGSNSGYSGAIGISAGATLKAVGSSSLGTGTVTINNTGVLALTNDGTGTGLGNGKQESISYGNAVVLSGAAQTITLGQFTAPATVNTLNAANKTLQLSTLATGATALTVTNGNGFGLEFTGATTLSGAAATGTTFSIGTANVSTAVFGLTLNGLASGGTTSTANNAVILTKSGVGTLLVNGVNSTFGGNSGATGQAINIIDGYLAAGTDAALGATGATGNVVQISTNNAGKGFLATGTFSTDRTFKLNNTANALDVTQGNTLTLTTPFTFSAIANGLQKNDGGTLELSNNNSTMTTGNFVVAQGALKISNASALGAVGTTASGYTQAASAQSAIQLNNVSIAEYFKIASYGMNNGGALQAVGGGTSTITGSLDLTGDGSLGADTGSTLTLSTTSVFPVTGAPAAGSTAFIVGGGTVNLLSTIGANTNGLTFYGTGTGNFNFATASQFNRALTVNGGYTVNLLGDKAFKQTGAGLNTGFTVNGSTVVFDNSVNAVANRLGGAAGSIPNLSRATLTFTGGGVVGEALGALTLGSGLTTLNTSGASAANILSFASQATRAAGAVVNVNSTGSSSVQFVTAPALIPATTGVLQGWFVGSEFATIAGGAANTPITAFSAYTTGDLGAVATTTATVKPSGAQTTVTTRTINALNLAGGVGVTIGSGQTLTLTEGGIINNGGADITGGFLTPGAELIAKYVTNGTISSAITSAQSLTKLGAGNLTLSAPADTQFTVGSVQNSYTGSTFINEGTLTLGGGNNTLTVNKALVLNGGTLALGGSNQYLGSFTSNTTAALGYGGSAGSVTGSGTLTTNAAIGTFAGDLGGSVNFVKAGGTTLILTSANSTTGAITVIGGGLTLRDSGTLLGITALGIKNSTLTLDNGSAANLSKDVANRVNDATAITLDGGVISYQGRIGFNSTESLGAVTLASGANSISANQPGTGVNSAQLTLASLTRSTGATLNLQRLSPAGTTNLGLIGSTPRIVVTAGQTTVGGIVPGVFFGEREFVGYTSGLGFGALGTVGFPAYYTTSASVSLASAPATGNVKQALNGTVASGGQTVNALNAATFDVAFSGANDVLTLTSGMYTNMGARSIGTTAVRGVLTSGSAELFLNAWHNSGSGITVHSKITGSNLLVLSSDGNGGNPAIRLTSPSNDYTGGTVVNSGPTIITILTLDNAGSPVAVPNATDPTKGLVLNNSQAIMSVSQGQIGAGNIATLNGGSTLTLFGNNSLAGLVFNSNGGTTVPTVNPGSTLTLTGNITSTPSNVAVVPLLGVAANGGNLSFGGATRTITVNAYTEGTYTNGATLVGLNVVAPIQNGGLTKDGAGLLQLTGVQVYTGATTINAGAIQAGAANAFSPFSSVSLTNTAGAFLDLNNQSNIIGSLSGGGTTGGHVGIVGATTLTLGADNTSPSAFKGNILGTTGILTKIGSGTQALSGTNTITGGVNLINGTLALDFSQAGAPVSNIMPSANALGLRGGTLLIKGNTSGTSDQTFTPSPTFLTGASKILVDPNGGTSTTVNLVGTLGPSSYNSGVSLLLGTSAGAGSGSAIITSAAAGSGTLPGRTVFTSDGGTTVDFTNATAGVLSAFTGYSTLPVSGANSGTLYKLTASTTLTASQTVRVLKIENPAAGQTLDLGNNALTLDSNGLLVTGTEAFTLTGTGNFGLTSGNANTNGLDVVLHQYNSGGLTVSAVVSDWNSGATPTGLTKSGPGSATLTKTNSYTGSTFVTQGTINLTGGNNSIVVNKPMVINAGATINFGSGNQYVGALSSTGTFEGNGGTITGSGLFTTNASSTAFGGNFTGSISLTKAGSNTMTLNSLSDTTGTINVIGTGLTLLDGGAFSNVSAINVKGATFTINNTGTKDMTDRVNAAPIALDGAVLTLNGRAGFNSTETLGAVTANSGASIISAAIGTGGSAQLTLSSLTRNNGASLLINPNASAGLGTVGNNPRILVNSALTGNLAAINGVIPGVFTSANTDNYHMVGYVAGLGFGALGTAGFPTTTANFATAGATDNVYDASSAVVSTNMTINSIRQPTISFANGTTTGGTDLLTIGSGMMITGSGGGIWGTATQRGRLTSGTQELFVLHRDGNAAPDPIINTVIVDKNGSKAINPTDKVSLVVHSPKQDRGPYVWLTAANLYSGGTFVSGGSGAIIGGILLNATTDGAVVIPAGGLTINNNGLVDMLGYQGQIESTNDVTINGGGALNLSGNNTLASLTFNSNGGTNVPTVGIYNSQTIVSGSNAYTTKGARTGILTITGNIISNPTNVAVTPLIDGGTLDLSGVQRTITVNPATEFSGTNGTNLNQVAAGLNITSLLSNGGIEKAGLGVLQLSGANSTYTGATNVNNGVLLAGATNAFGSGASPLTIANLSTAWVNISANNVAIGSLTGGGALGGNLLTTGGILTIGGDNTSTSFAGRIISMGALTKAGTGMQTLTGNNSVSANTFVNGGGGLTVNGAGSALVIGGQFTLGSTAAAGNSMVISGGATMSVGGSFWTGGGAGNPNNGQTGNTLTVTGAGSTLTLSTTYDIADRGTNNFNILSGGVVNSPFAYYSYFAEADNNSILVDGAGSVYNFAGMDMANSAGATGNAVTVSNAGVVNTTGSVVIAGNSGSNNNSVTVTGASAAWNFTSATAGSRNLTISNNAGATGNSFSLNSGGALTNANTLTVDGTSSALNIGNGTSTSTVSAATVTLSTASARLNVNSGRLTALAAGAMVSGSGEIVLNGAGFFSTAFASTITSGKISGVGSLTKEGAGKLTLTNTASNTYAGDTIITNGTLQVGTGAVTIIPNGVGVGNVVMNGGATVAGVLDINDFNIAINGLSGTAGTVLGQVVNNGSAALRTLTVGNNDVTAAFAGLIKNNTTGTGTVALTKVGTGVQTLSGANTYSGLTTVNAGTVQFGVDQAIAVGNAVTISAVAGLTATLDLNGFAATIGGAGLSLGGADSASVAQVIGTGLGSTLTLSGGATALAYLATNDPMGSTISTTNLLLDDATQTFTVGDSVTATDDLTISSALASVGASSALVKAGAGVLTLSGVQSYDSLTANAGTTNVNGVLGTASGTAAVVVSGAGTTLKFGSVSQTLSSLTIGAGSFVTFSSGAASGSLTSGGVAKAPSFSGGGSVVPEPGTIGLLLIGAIGVLNRRRRAG